MKDFTAKNITYIFSRNSQQTKRETEHSSPRGFERGKKGNTGRKQYLDMNYDLIYGLQKNK